MIPKNYRLTPGEYREFHKAIAALKLDRILSDKEIPGIKKILLIGIKEFKIKTGRTFKYSEVLDVNIQFPEGFGILWKTKVPDIKIKGVVE